MGFTELNGMLQEAVDKIKNMLDGNSVIGSPILGEGTTVVPVSKISTGFVTGGYDMKTRSIKVNEPGESQPIAAIGGGVTVTPVGFLVISDGTASFIKAQGDGTDKWLDIIQNTIKSAFQK